MNDFLTRQVSLFNMKNICKIFEKMADSSQLIISLILPSSLSSSSLSSTTLAPYWAKIAAFTASLSLLTLGV